METVLEGIVSAIEQATTGWKVELGFSTDVTAWVEDNRSSGRTILVTFDSDEPARVGESGRTRSWRMSGAVWMRTRADAKKFLKDVWPTYKAVRAALDGLELTEDGAGYQLTLGAGRASVADGWAIPTLTFSVQ